MANQYQEVDDEDEAPGSNTAYEQLQDGRKDMELVQW